jgi:uncharacterized protein (TIRG00374 family)
MRDTKVSRAERIWSQLKALRPLWLLIFLGIAVHVLLPQFAELSHLGEVLVSAAWWAIGLSVAVQVLSYLSSGYVLHSLVKIFKQKLSVVRGVLVTMGSYSLGLMGGGWVTTGAVTYQWVRNLGVDAEAAGLAGSIPLFLNNVALIVIAAIGLIYLLVIHELTSIQIIAFVLVLAVMLGMAGLAFLAAGHRRQVAHIANIWRERLASRFNIRISEERVSAGIRDFFVDWDAMFKGKFIFPLLGAFGNVLFDALTLYFLFVAIGNPLNLGILLAGYGLPLLLAKVAFIFPGGVGIVESSMAALFASLGVSREKAIIAVLGYRIFSFWLPVLFGFPVIAFIRRLAAEK